jgi:hypothetical protein
VLIEDGLLEDGGWRTTAGGRRLEDGDDLGIEG